MPSLSSAGTSPALLAVRRDIESMKTRGAGEIGKQAVYALAQAGATWTGTDRNEFDAFLLEAARLLSAARPTAVTLRNGLNRTLHAVARTTNLARAKATLAKVAQEYGRGVDEAKQSIARHALEFLQDGDVILTHCHSTAAGGAIAHAAKKRKGITVFATETRPFRQGIIQAPALARQGVDVTLIVDSAVAHTIETMGVTKVVVGADTIDAKGGLYNKIGTRQVALLAKAFKVPLIVCAERDKFSPYTLNDQPVVIEERAATEIADPSLIPGVKVRNPVFDRTPPTLVHTYVTEKGPLAPRDVRAFIQSEFRDISLLV